MAAFTPAGCVAALAALVNGIAGIANGAGIVHTRRRIIRNESDIKGLLVGSDGDGKVNAWMISSAASATSVTTRHPGFNAIGAPGGGQALTVFQFQIEGYFQIDDVGASEEIFRDLSWLIATTINSYGQLNIAGIVEQLPADIEQFGYVLLANTGFYHYARLGCGFRGRTQP